jgi:hypothetical protein
MHFAQKDSYSYKITPRVLFLQIHPTLYISTHAPQGRRLGDKRLEIVESADVVLHVAWY